MATLEAGRIAGLLEPYVTADLLTPELMEKISRYLDLLVLWNGRTNLTAVRDPEQLVQRQIGESLYAAQYIPAAAGSLLDFGSGAGFPGIPLQLARPSLSVTLAESQGKKASFLRETIRTLRLSTTVWAKRVEDLPALVVFDVVTMRAVDKSEAMTSVALARVAPGGMLLRYTGAEDATTVPGWNVTVDTRVPESRGRLQVLSRLGCST